MTATATQPVVVAAPDPGFYPGMTEDEYRGDPGAAQSILKIFALRSAEHAKYQLDHPKEPTAVMQFGTALHMAVLQPERFEAEYQIAQPCQAVLKSGPNAGASCGKSAESYGGEWFCGTHSRGQISDNVKALSAEDHQRAVIMRDRMRGHPRGKRILEGVQHTELPAFWIDPGSGLRCKLLADAVGAMKLSGGREYLFAFDLKTTRDASPHGFERQAFDLGYWIQAAHYTIGLDAVGLPVDGFIFGAIEHEPPHGRRFYRCTDRAIEMGMKLLLGEDGKSGLYARWKRCIESNQFPGYDIRFGDLDLPAFGMGRINDLIEQMGDDDYEQ